MNPGGRNIGEDALASKFPIGELVVEQFFNAQQTSAFRRGTHKRLGFANRNVFKEAERAAFGGELVEVAESLFDKVTGEIIERQSRDDALVFFVVGKLLDGHFENADTAGDLLPVGFTRKPITQSRREACVELHQVESIVWTEAANDLGGDSAGAGANLEDVAREFVAADLAGQGFAEIATAGEHRSRGVKGLTKFPPKDLIFFETRSHGRILCPQRGSAYPKEGGLKVVPETDTDLLLELQQRAAKCVLVAFAVEVLHASTEDTAGITPPQPTRLSGQATTEVEFLPQ